MYKLYPHLGFAGQAALGTTVERVDAWPMLYMAFEAGQSIVTHLRRVLGLLLHTITSERAPGFGVEGDGSHMQVLPQSAISFSSRQRYFEVASALYSEFCVLRSAATEAQAPTRQVPPLSVAPGGGSGILKLMVDCIPSFPFSGVLRPKNICATLRPRLLAWRSPQSEPEQKALVFSQALWKHV